MYFSDDVETRPYLLVLPTARRSARGERSWRLAIYREGGWSEGRSDAVYGGRAPWRLLLRKVALVDGSGRGRRPPSRNRFRLSVGDHVLLVPARRQDAPTDSAVVVKLLGVAPERDEAIARARRTGHRVLVCQVAIIGYPDAGASRTLVWDGQAGTARFEDGSVEV